MLKIKVVEGVLYRDTETFTKMDPYVLIRVGGKKYKTKAMQEAGQTPVWNEILTIPFTSMEDRMLIQCYDEDIFVDDLVGQCSFSVYELCHG